MSNQPHEPGVAEDAPLSRDTGATMSHPMSPPMAAPIRIFQLRPRRIYPIETKPFFLTSEFVGAVLAIAGIADHRCIVRRVRSVAGLDLDHGCCRRLHGQPRHREVGHTFARPTIP